jgi:FtsH-binding integral membrane protein
VCFTGGSIDFGFCLGSSLLLECAMTIVESPEQKRETATSLIIIGWICWAFALLVMFFNPAAMRLGRLGMVYTAIVLAVAGLLLNIVGYRLRSRARLSSPDANSASREPGLPGKRS